MNHSCKHRRCDTTALVRTIPETFKGLGLSQQLVFGSTKAMLAGWYITVPFSSSVSDYPKSKIPEGLSPPGT